MALFWISVLNVCLIFTVGATFPANEYEYSVKRQWLFEAEEKFEGKINDLNQNETLVDHYLQYLKWAEFKATQHRFLPFLPVNQTTMVEIMQSSVYKALVHLPKGGSMHTHENHEVSRADLLDMLWDSDEFQYLYVTTEEYERGPWRLDFFVRPPDEIGWLKMDESNVTKEELLSTQTLLGVMTDYAKSNPSNSGQRWMEMNPLWGRAAGLLNNINIKKAYIQKMYEKNLKEGVQYLETRKSVGSSRLYRLDPDEESNDGKVFLETKENAGELEINITMEILEDFIKENPSFIGHKTITYTTRSNTDLNYNWKNMEKALRLHKMYPDHLVGFDLVGEEDAGNSHLFFLENFMKLYDPNTGETKIPLFQHTGESSWPQDLITSRNDKDPVSTNQNTYEAILMGSRRVGHGLAYYKHPYLMKLLKDKDVAIEICPVSNQILGFIPDIRNHPAVEYIRTGLPVILGTDDPGTFGVDHFNLDWYMAFMAWGLDLTDMKKISYNAVKYSAMTDAEKINANGKLDAAWEKYIDEILVDACSISSTSVPVVGRLLPREGAKIGGTKIHIFGHNFEAAIQEMCEGRYPRCRFGEKETPALYLSNYHIVCEAPKPDAENVTEVDVSLSLVHGKWLETGQKFVYKYDEFTTTIDIETTTEPPTTTESYSGSRSSHKQNMLPAIFLSFCLLKIFAKLVTF